MSDYIDSKSLEELFHWSSSAVVIAYFLATKTEIFGRKLDGGLEVVKDTAWFVFAAALLAKNMRISKTRVAKVSAMDVSVMRKKRIRKCDVSICFRYA